MAAMIRLALSLGCPLGVPVDRWHGDAPLLRLWPTEDGGRGASYTAAELAMALACCEAVPMVVALRAWELMERGNDGKGYARDQNQ